MTDSFAYEYEIGLDPGEMVNVESLAYYLCPPPVGRTFKPYAVYATTVSGKEVGDGFPVCEWLFDYLNDVMLNALLSFLGGEQSAAVYIRTKNDVGEYALYLAIMQRARVGDEKSWETMGWRNIKVRFTYLQEIEE